MGNLFKTVLAAAAAMLIASCAGQQNQNSEKENMIRLNVTVNINPESSDEVIAALNQLAAESRKEEGCIGYEIFRNTIRPDQVIIVETWKDQASLDAHGQTPHYTTILPPLGDKMKMTLERFDF